MDLKKEFEEYMRDWMGEKIPEEMFLPPHDPMTEYDLYKDNVITAFYGMFQALYPEIYNAYSALAMYGVPTERAGTIANGIEVLMTRMKKAGSGRHVHTEILSDKPIVTSIPTDISFGEVGIAVNALSIDALAGVMPIDKVVTVANDYNIKAMYVVSGDEVIGFSSFKIYLEEKEVSSNLVSDVYKELYELAITVASHDNERRKVECL